MRRERVEAKSFNVGGNEREASAERPGCASSRLHVEAQNVPSPTPSRIADCCSGSVSPRGRPMTT
jgi:hypothetical protein